MVLSSRTEGFLCALEAMALQKPVVGSEVMGIRDCVESGVTACSSPAVTPKPWLETWIVARRHDALPNYGRKGQGTAMREFSPQGMIESLESLYAQARKVSGTNSVCRRGGGAVDGRADGPARGV
jgi:glycosyltransferase involved in cell wall biosynthesis